MFVIPADRKLDSKGGDTAYEDKEKSPAVEQAEQMLAESAAWMKENTGELKFHGFRYLCIIAASEGMTPGEKQFLYRVAEMTGIPRNVAGDLIHEVMTRFVGKKVSGATAVQNLK